MVETVGSSNVTLTGSCYMSKSHLYMAGKFAKLLVVTLLDKNPLSSWGAFSFALDIV